MRYQEVSLATLILMFYSLEVVAYTEPRNERNALSRYDTHTLAELISNNTNFRAATERLVAINNQMEEMKIKLKTESSFIAENFAIMQETMNNQSSIGTQLMTELPVLKELANSVGKKMPSIEQELNKTQMFQKKLEERDAVRSYRMHTNTDIEKGISIFSSNVAFFVQRNRSYAIEGSMIPYTHSQLNLGGSFNKTSGIFTVPMKGIYYFHFTALKTKKEYCGTSRLTVQLTQLGTPKRMLAEGHVNSNDWYGWFPVHLQATVLLQKNDFVGVQLLEGSIHETGDPSHLTSFIGFLVNPIA